jgi:hypothetical protein
MSVTFRRTARGTTIRATGGDAFRLLEALASCMDEPEPSKPPAKASEPVPNRSKLNPSTTAAGKAPRPHNGPGSEPA